MKDVLSRFHRCERGNMKAEQLAVLCVVFAATLLILNMSGLAVVIRECVRQTAPNLRHYVIALVILFGGTYIGTKSSRSFSQSWGWAELSICAALLYLALFVGVPMVMQSLHERLDALMKLSF